MFEKYRGKDNIVIALKSKCSKIVILLFDKVITIDLQVAGIKI